MSVTITPTRADVYADGGLVVIAIDADTEVRVEEQTAAHVGLGLLRIAAESGRVATVPVTFAPDARVAAVHLLASLVEAGEYQIGRLLDDLWERMPEADFEAFREQVATFAP